MPDIVLSATLAAAGALIKVVQLADALVGVDSEILLCKDRMEESKRTITYVADELKKKSRMLDPRFRRYVQESLRQSESALKRIENLTDELLYRIMKDGRVKITQRFLWALSDTNLEKECRSLLQFCHATMLVILQELRRYPEPIAITNTGKNTLRRSRTMNFASSERPRTMNFASSERPRDVRSPELQQEIRRHNAQEREERLQHFAELLQG